MNDKRGPTAGANHAYRTTSTDAAAFLLTVGHALVGTREVGGRVQFEFAGLPDKTPEQSLFEFASGAPVSGKLLLQNLTLVRDLMKDASRTNSTNERWNEGEAYAGRPRR